MFCQQKPVRQTQCPNSYRMHKLRTHLLDMRNARRADDDRIPVLALQQAVVRHPAQRDLREGQPVRGRRSLDRRERGEVRVFPVAAAVVL